MRGWSSLSSEPGSGGRPLGAAGRLARAGHVLSLALVVGAATLAYGLPGAVRAAAVTPAAAPSAAPVTSRSIDPSGPATRPVSQPVPLDTMPAASAEVPSLRTRTSDTYLVNGEYEAVVSSGSINYQDVNGAWQPIDDTLVGSSVAGYAWQNKANRYTLLLPKTLSAAPIVFQSPTGTIRLQLHGAGGTATVSGASVTYANAASGLSVTLTAENDSVKETLRLAGPPVSTTLTYSLGLSPGLTASATTAGGIAVADASGKVQFSFDPPTMADAAGVEAPLSGSVLTPAISASGQTITLALDPTWLSSTARQWPVVVDPSINYDVDQDCQIQSGTKADTNLCGSGQYLYTGYGGEGANVRRSVLQFDLQDAIPAGAQVTHAGLAVYLEWSSTSNYGSVSLHQVTQAWTDGVTWNDYDGSNAWTTPGGTYASTALASKTPTSAGWYYWSGSGSSQLAQSWLSGTAANDGVILRADNEANNELYTYDSTRTGSSPYFYVTYVNALGARSTSGAASHQLTDRSSLDVDVANGNLVLTGNDLQIAGTGLSLTVQRIFNSLSGGGAFGTWLMGSGADEKLSFEDGNVDFQGSGGFDLTFYANGSGGYIPPPGLDASLVQNPGGTYTLTYNSSQEKLSFTSAGVLTSDVDRNGDTITYTSSGGTLSSITDAQGRQLSFSYQSPVGSTLISKITDSTGRTWQYGYTSTNGYAELTQYTDPAGKVTSYGYDSSGRVSTITDPLGNETTFAYDANSRVTSITYVTNTGNGTGPTTGFAYHPHAQGSCTSPTGDVLGGYTVVTDADSHATTYCYDLQGLVIQTIDPDSNTSSSSYTGDQQVAVATDALSQSTTASYDSSNVPTEVTAPADGSGQTPPSDSATYNTPSTVTGYQYLPSSVTDAQGNCTAYVYDAAGNVTDTYAGQASPCDGQTGGVHSGTRYQGDPGVSCGAKTGEVCAIIDANGNATTYGYDSAGENTSVTPPSPQGSETITYDPLSRVSTVIDGNGNKTTYSYDKLDRVTQILYGGATTCTPSSGDCIAYTFDADGNRTSMTDQSGTTSYYYDALNRMTTESLPDSSSACAGSSPSGITYGYDGAGNMTTYCDSGGTTSYAYDPDNRLVSIAEPGGSCGPSPSLCTTFGYDANGDRTLITFPGGATQATTYDNDGNVTSVVGKSSTGTTLTSFAYTYANGANDTALVQTRGENDAVASNTYTYSYNAANQLTAATVTSGTGTSYGYTYDADGNLLSKTAGGTATSYAYNTADELCWVYVGTSSNACSSAPTGSTTYSFDANGNETASSGGASFSYNSKNQTTSITDGGATLSNLAYTDQGQANRISAGTTTFDNSADGTAISTTSGSSTYYLTDSQGQVIGERIGSAHYYFLTDAQGSVVAVISGDGQTVADRYGYDPYGATTNSSVTVANPFGYAGGYADLTALIHFGARYYDPSTARWTQVDPGATGQASAYSYASGDPIDEVDPSGRFPGVNYVNLQVSRWGWPWTDAWVQIWFHVAAWIIPIAVWSHQFLAGLVSLVIGGLSRSWQVAAASFVAAEIGFASVDWFSNDGNGEWWHLDILVTGSLWFLPWWTGFPVFDVFWATRA